MDNNTKTIDKIKKLLKLGKETNFSGESDQALAAAMRLAAGLGMTVDEISLNEEDSSEISEYNIYKEKYHFQKWELLLASGIADALGCVPYMRTGFCHAERKRNERLILIGIKQDAELFNWLYPYVLKQLRRLCREDYEKNSWMFPNKSSFETAWYKGASARITILAKERFQKETTPQEQEQYALVVTSKKEKCENYLDNMKDMHQHHEKKRNYDHYAARMGYAAGDKVNMSRPIGNNEQQAIA